MFTFFNLTCTNLVWNFSNHGEISQKSFVLKWIKNLRPFKKKVLQIMFSFLWCKDFFFLEVTERQYVFLKWIKYLRPFLKNLRRSCLIFFCVKNRDFKKTVFLLVPSFMSLIFLYVWIKGINVLEGIKKSFRFGELFRGMVFKQ